MRIPRTITCSVWYQLRCGILRHTAVFNNAVQLITHFILNAQLIYNALLAYSVYNALLIHSVYNTLLTHSIYLTHFKQ
jgi:hypothetical protein